MSRVANNPVKTININSFSDTSFQVYKQKGNDNIEMPTEYQTINCISENFFDRNF